MCNDLLPNCKFYVRSWNVTFWVYFQTNWMCFVFDIGMLQFSRVSFIFIYFQRHVHSISLWGMIKQSKRLQTRYATTYIYDKYYTGTHLYAFLLSVKNACLNYHEFDLEGDFVRVPHRRYLSGQSIIKILKHVWGEFEMMAMINRTMKCVDLQRTWVSTNLILCHHNQ